VADVPALLDFAARSFAERFPLNSNWHPGDIVWELQGAYDQRQAIRIWDGPEGVVAVAWFVGQALLWLETTPAHEDLVPELVGWAEAALRNQPEAPGLSIRAYGEDARRIAALERLGYRRSGPEGVCFRMGLRAPRARFDPPPGYRVIDSTGVDPERRAAAHRDAWNDLSHIGLPAARSSFSAERYLSLRAAPVYDPALDMLMRAPDGALVSNCICWADAVSGIGVFEPVGTSPAYRGRGLARATIAEGLRRLEARGHAWARVGTAHFNAPAIAAYRSCGFEMYDRTWWWTKA